MNDKRSVANWMKNEPNFDYKKKGMFEDSKIIFSTLPLTHGTSFSTNKFINQFLG